MLKCYFKSVADVSKVRATAFRSFSGEAAKIVSLYADFSPAGLSKVTEEKPSEIGYGVP